MSPFFSGLEDWPAHLLTVLSTFLSIFDCFKERKNRKSSEISQITSILFRAYFHLWGFIKMAEACGINFSSKYSLIIKIRFLTSILHLTSGRKVMFIQGSWAVTQEWVPDAMALKTLASTEGLCLSWYKELRRINFLSKPNDSVPSIAATWKKRIYLPCQVMSIHRTGPRCRQLCQRNQNIAEESGSM